MDPIVVDSDDDNDTMDSRKPAARTAQPPPHQQAPPNLPPPFQDDNDSNNEEDEDNLDSDGVIARLLNETRGGSLELARHCRDDGSLPLHLALRKGLRLSEGVGRILQAYPEAVSVRDPQTNLLPFLLASVGENAEVETIYSVLILRPNLVDIMAKRQSVE